MNPSNNKHWKLADAEDKDIPLEVRAFDVDTGSLRAGSKKGVEVYELRYIKNETPDDLKKLIGNACYMDVITQLNAHPLLCEAFALDRLIMPAHVPRAARTRHLHACMRTHRCPRCPRCLAWRPQFGSRESQLAVRHGVVRHLACAAQALARADPGKGCGGARRSGLQHFGPVHLSTH